MAAAGAAGAPFNATSFVAGLGYSRGEFLIILIVGVVFFGTVTLVSGPLAEHIGWRLMHSMVSVISIGIDVFGLLFPPLSGDGIVGLMAWLILCAAVAPDIALSL